MPINEAIGRSKEMMRGNKWRLFCVEISFIGWALLSVITCGIGFLWLLPYMSAAECAFFYDVSGRYSNQNSAPNYQVPPSNQQYQNYNQYPNNNQQYPNNNQQYPNNNQQYPNNNQQYPNNNQQYPNNNQQYPNNNPPTQQ